MLNDTNIPRELLVVEVDFVVSVALVLWLLGVDIVVCIVRAL
jgi:hypothetical protein